MLAFSRFTMFQGPCMKEANRLSFLNSISRTSRTPVGLAVDELAGNVRDSSLC